MLCYAGSLFTLVTRLSGALLLPASHIPIPPRHRSDHIPRFTRPHHRSSHFAFSSVPPWLQLLFLICLAHFRYRHDLCWPNQNSHIFGHLPSEIFLVQKNPIVLILLDQPQSDFMLSVSSPCSSLFPYSHPPIQLIVYFPDDMLPNFLELSPFPRIFEGDSASLLIYSAALFSLLLIWWFIFLVKSGPIDVLSQLKLTNIRHFS